MNAREFSALAILLPQLAFPQSSQDNVAKSALGNSNQNVHCIDSFFGPAFQTVLVETRKNYRVDKVVFVFDIDHTLLTTDSMLGGRQWNRWQRSLRIDDPFKIACFEDVAATIYHFAHLFPTENKLPDLIRSVQDLGHSVIALTARGSHLRPATERGLRRNGYDFRDSAIETMESKSGFAGNYFPDLDEPINDRRVVSYQNGILMAAGQNKGALLLDLLKRTEKLNIFDAIFFSDDSQRNINNMHHTAAMFRAKTYMFHYTRTINSFSISDFEKIVPEFRQSLTFFYENLVRHEACSAY